jgi:hypothetical protein
LPPQNFGPDEQRHFADDIWLAVARAVDGCGLIWLPHGRGLQLNDCPLNPKPDKLPVAITAFEYLIGSPGCHDLSLGFMFSDQQVGGSPDVAIGDHSASSRSAALWPSATSFLLVRSSSHRKNTIPGEFYTASLGSPLGITPLRYFLSVSRLEDPAPFGDATQFVVALGPRVKP